MHNIYTRLAKGFCFVFVSFWTPKVEPGTRLGPRGGAGAGRTVGSELQRKTWCFVQEINGRIYPKSGWWGASLVLEALLIYNWSFLAAQTEIFQFLVSLNSKKSQFSVINDEEKRSYFTFLWCFCFKKKWLKSAIISVSTILSFLAHTWNAVILSFTDLLACSEG